MDQTKKNLPLIKPFSKKLHCSKCNCCICERVSIINMALNYIEKQLCLKCIAKEKNIMESEVFANLYEYINSRPCFKADWKKIDIKECPKYPACYCGDCND